MLPRIEKIISKNGFELTCLWTTQEVRVIDFNKFLVDYPTSLRNKILQTEIFSTIEFNPESKTIFFPAVLKGLDTKGKEYFGELDFCPDVLYANSQNVIL